MRSNPVAIDTWRAMQGFGSEQKTYLYCLMFQTLTLILWWPNSGLGAALSKQQEPVTLFATLLAVAFSMSYQAMRCGGEEQLGDEQQSIREWVVATRLSLGTLLSGYLLAHLAQNLQWMFLSLPIILVAYSIGDCDGYGLTLNLLAIVLICSFFRLISVCVYLLLGHFDDLVYYLNRLLLFGVFIGSGWLVDNASYWQVAPTTFSGVRTNLLISPPEAFVEFLTIQGALIALACFLLIGLFHFRRTSFKRIVS